MLEFDGDDSAPNTSLISSKSIEPEPKPEIKQFIPPPPVSGNELFGQKIKIAPKIVNPKENILIGSKVDPKKKSLHPGNVANPKKEEANISHALPPSNHSLLTDEFNKKLDEKQSPFNKIGQQISPIPEKLKNHQINPQTIKQFRTAFKLIDLIRNNIFPARVKGSQPLEITLTNTSVSRLLQDYFCITCQKFSFIVKLTCSHSACLFCLQSSLLNLANSPSLNSYKQSRCKSCFLIPTKKDINFVLSSEIAETIYSLNITKQCTLCERNLELMTGYLPELECLHLCRECYLNDMLYGGTKCTCCLKDYDAGETTLQRVEQCSHCFKDGKLADNYFRALHSNHYLCPGCLIESLVKGDYKCPTCMYQLDARDIGALHMFIYKTCSGCNFYKPFNEIHECSCSYNFCHACIQKNNHICS